MSFSPPLLPLCHLIPPHNASLLQSGVPATGCSPLGYTSSSVGFPWTTVPSGNIHELWHGVLQVLWVDTCSSTVLPLDCGGTPAPLCSSPRAAGECLLRHLVPPPTPSALSPEGYFSHIFPHPSLPGSILPFSKCIFLKGPAPWLQGSAMPCNGATGATWKGLCPARSSPGHSSQRSLKPPCLHLGTCTLYTFSISFQFSGLTVFLTHMLQPK